MALKTLEDANPFDGGLASEECKNRRGRSRMKLKKMGRRFL